MTDRHEQPPIGDSGECHGYVTLIGAGELMPAMSKVHREALALVEPPVRAVFLDTSFGYESNADVIAAKAVEYYAHRLQTELCVASYRHARRATLSETARAVADIRAANFIFAGPGSPTFALDHWRDSAVWDAVVGRFRHGAHVLFASAASITLGRYTLPVYEIYKAGRDPYWVEGMDLLGELGLKLAIVPHYNDNSGGEYYDSRFCYMGAARFDELQALLPPDVTIVALDEYTAARFEPARGVVCVAGQGALTVIGDGALSRYVAGAVVPFERLQSSRRSMIATYRRDEAPSAYEFGDPVASNGLPASLADYVATLPLDSTLRVELLARVEAATTAATRPTVNEDALLGLILELRQALRELKHWDLADRVRDTLLQLSYEVQDSPEGSVWRRRA